MTPFDLADDETLLDVLSTFIDLADPVPESAVAAAKAIAQLSEIDAELATLVADSLVDDGIGLRHDVTMDTVGAPSERLVSFATPRLHVDVDLQADGSTMVGAITPPMSVEVELETAGARASTTSDELGRFHFPIRPGQCRLRIHVHDGAVVTPWITR